MIYQEGIKSNRRQWLGHILAACLGVIFVAVYALATFQLDFWQKYFFYDSTHFAAECRVDIANIADNQFRDFKPDETRQLKVPHTPDIFPRVMPDHFLHVRYRCALDLNNQDVSNAAGVVFVHTGWVFAKHARIAVNGSERLTFHGNDKPVIPLTAADLSRANVEVDIYTIENQNGYVGLSGFAPMVLSSGNQINSKIFGLEISLQQIRYIYNIVPVLTMSFFLIIGWATGYRSRIFVTTFYYFFMIATKNILTLFADIWPWDILMTYTLIKPFYMGALMGFIIFGMEVMTILPNLINRAMLISFGLVTLECLIVSGLIDGAEAGLSFMGRVEPIQSSVLLACMVAFLVLGVQKLRVTRNDYRPIYIIFLLGAALYTTLVGADFISAALSQSWRLQPKMDIVMPFFVGFVVLYNLSLIEKKYQEEAKRRQKMEHDLELAKEIQDSLALPPPETVFAGMKVSCFQIKHSQVAGDWMAVRRCGDDEMIVLVADVTGKGVQAALVVHAIQSLWADALAEDTFAPGTWIAKVNRTLFRLGERRPHSATMGLLSIRKDRLKYWCMGHTPLFVVIEDAGKPRVQPLISRGGILGVSQEVTIESKELPLAGLETFHILLGSDGVFDKGSRTRSREVTEFLALVKKCGPASLEGRDEHDDRTLVYVNNAS